MIEVHRYTQDRRTEWDNFVRGAKNSTFLFLRGYMDYHSDRFRDCSLMFYDERNRLVGLLPANLAEDTLYSHRGLTYGGLLMTSGSKTAVVRDAGSHSVGISAAADNPERQNGRRQRDSHTVQQRACDRHDSACSERRVY